MNHDSAGFDRKFNQKPHQKPQVSGHIKLSRSFRRTQARGRFRDC